MWPGLSVSCCEGSDDQLTGFTVCTRGRGEAPAHHSSPLSKRDPLPSAFLDISQLTEGWGCSVPFRAHKHTRYGSFTSWSALNQSYQAHSMAVSYPSRDESAHHGRGSRDHRVCKSAADRMAKLTNRQGLWMSYTTQGRSSHAFIYPSLHWHATRSSSQTSVCGSAELSVSFSLQELLGNDQLKERSESSQYIHALLVLDRQKSSCGLPQPGLHVSLIRPKQQLTMPHSQAGPFCPRTRRAVSTN